MWAKGRRFAVNAKLTDTQRYPAGIRSVLYPGTRRFTFYEHLASLVARAAKRETIKIRHFLVWKTFERNTLVKYQRRSCDHRT